jgi:iron(III) transport system substrate-binding protein
MLSIRRLTVVALIALLALSACAPAPAAAPAVESSAESSAPSGKLVVYSGRSENLVAPVIEKFEAASGIDVEVRYAGTAELAATILEEGDNSPADVFFSQDAGALGALAKAGRLAALPDSITTQVDSRFRSPENLWTGITGRARVLIHNTDSVAAEELPDDVYGLTDPQWKGRVGWAPSNASFQTFVTALRLLDGEDAARQWLEAMIANDVQLYDGNDAIVAAVGAGEVDLGLVNHYYLYQFLKEQGESFPADNFYFPTAGAGSIVNVAGAGVLDTADNPEAAQSFISYLLSPEGQEYFAVETVEYPLLIGAEASADLPPLSEVAHPDLDLSNLDDLQGTLQLLQDTGAIQ